MTLEEFIAIGFIDRDFYCTILNRDAVPIAGGNWDQSQIMDYMDRDVIAYHINLHAKIAQIEIDVYPF